MGSRKKIINQSNTILIGGDVFFCLGRVFWYYIYTYILKIFRISSPFPHHIYIYMYIYVYYYIEDISNSSIFNWRWYDFIKIFAELPIFPFTQNPQVMIQQQRLGFISQRKVYIWVINS